MAESSALWTTNGTGDGLSGGFTRTELAGIFRLLTVSPNYGGVIADYEFELSVTISGSTLSVRTGKAIAYGFVYTNTATVNLTFPTPTTQYRFDRVVLRASWSLQTVRLTRVAGTEGNPAPSLTQSAGTTWDIPLYTILCQPTGTVEIYTDDREYISLVAPLGVTEEKLAASAVATDGLLNETVSSTNIADGAVTASKIASGAVTAVKIDASQVTSTKVATDAVSTSQITDGEVGSTEIIDSAVTTDKLATDSVGESQLGTSAVEAAAIPDSSVATSHILDGEIGASHIADGEIEFKKFDLEVRPTRYFFNSMNVWSTMLVTESWQRVPVEWGCYWLIDSTTPRDGDVTLIVTASVGTVPVTWCLQGVSALGASITIAGVSATTVTSGVRTVGSTVSLDTCGLLDYFGAPYYVEYFTLAVYGTLGDNISLLQAQLVLEFD
jgi:hypothetical protein